MDIQNLPTVGQFVLDPHWDNWWVIIYFFIGGLASGAYFTAAMAQLFGADHHRGIINTAHLLAVPLTLVCAVLLTADLGRPERFWHMVLQSKTFWPMFKWWSPMSIGAVALMMFGAFTAASFLNALYERGMRLPFGNFMNALHRGPIGTVFNFVGSAVGFFIASYTGVLLNSTNQPFWGDQTMLGALFLASAASTGVAATLLLTPRTSENRLAIAELEGLDRWVNVLEIVVLVIFFVTLGALAVPVLLSPFGWLILIGVLGLGLLAPLVLLWRGHGTRAATLAAPALVLVGGFLLRYAVVMMSANIG